MVLKEKFFHGVEDLECLKNILQNGLLSRKLLQENNNDSFTSKQDFLYSNSINGITNISVSKYKSLSYYVFGITTIMLIIDSNVNVTNKNEFFEGECHIKDFIPVKSILGIGGFNKNFNISKFKAAQLLSNDREKFINFKNYVKKYYDAIQFIMSNKLTFKVYDCNSGNVITFSKIIKCYEMLLKLGDQVYA